MIIYIVVKYVSVIIIKLLTLRVFHHLFLQQHLFPRADIVNEERLKAASVFVGVRCCFRLKRQ